MSFATLLSEALASPELPNTGDVLAVGLPLLRQIDDLHQRGLVTRLQGTDSLVYDGVALRLPDDFSQSPPLDSAPGVAAVRSLNPAQSAGGIEVTARFDHNIGSNVVGEYRSRDVHDDIGDQPPGRPTFVVGHRAWEQLHDVHDQITDVHLAGLILVSYATGLDLSLTPAVDDLALGHRHLLRLNPALHPVVANVLSEMVDPDRHARPRSMFEALTRLEHHRELPSDLDLTAAYSVDPSNWRNAVLSSLRERVFDTSRRNRALYFRPSSAAISLTEASVPLMLNIERIKPEDLLTWTGENIDAFSKGKPVDLARWCRFEESPHLAPGLEKMISDERKLRAEHGSGRLRLVIAFLRWVDPENGDVVNSPLLTMAADLSKKKGVKDRYRVAVDSTADVNPVLRHILSSRFGVDLPETIEADTASISAFVEDLERRVQVTDPGLTIDLIDKPRVSLIRRRAQLRVDAYLRRRAQAQASSGRWRRNDYSYDRDDWRPLGLTLFRRFVEPTELPLRMLAGADPTEKRTPGFAATREREAFAMANGDVSRQRWEVDLCSVTIASLGTRRSTLARDYDELLLPPSADTPPMPDTPFDLMFSPERRRADHNEVAPISVDQFLVLPADSTQAAAVRRGLQGDSFIIQGPPGTGKSQTITNLIAGMVADGKRVLFVCEKRAALDVVAHRLRQVGLGSLVATIHDSELDRKPFIAELGDTYAAFSEPATSADEEARAGILVEVEALLRPLEITFAGLHQPTLGRLSMSEAIERLVILRVGGAGNDAPVPSTGVPVDSWMAARPALNRTQAALVASNLEPDLSMHAALRIAPAYIQSVEPLSALPVLGARLVDAIDRILTAVDRLPSVDGSTISGDQLATLTTNGRTLAAMAERSLGGIVHRAGHQHAELQRAHQTTAALAAGVAVAQPARDLWSQALSAQDARTGLDVARGAEESIGRFFNGRWRSLKKLVESSYRFDAHQVKPTITQVLTDLVAFHDAEQAYGTHRQQLTAFYGTENTTSLLTFVDAVSHDPLVSAVAASPAAVDLPGLLRAADDVAAVRPHMLVDNTAPLVSVRAIGVGLGSMSVAHERAVLAWGELAHAPGEVLVAALSHPSLDTTERSILEYALTSARQQGHLSPMTSAQLDDAVDRLLVAYRRLLDANGQAILERARQRFSDNLAFSEASMAGRSDADKDLKKRYNAGRRLLEREFSKKMRFRPIRELASGDSGLVVRDLRPVWLMSPLSVSTTLPLDSDLFDVVIFDEASQIPVEDAVPTLFRARQTIVVGDRMQLPPTRFFSAASEGDELLVDDDGFGVTISLDADSFLTQADQTLDSVMLAWHYRSRSECLIDYSNHAFYDGRLATVPDRIFEPAERDELVAESSDDAARLLAPALERPISFHRITDGVYRDRVNAPEAAYVAELVRSLLMTRAEGDPGLTIGVAAFSEAQQTAIEEAINDLTIDDPAFALAFEAETQRSDDGEYVGLFIKNLENVQGDERDVIIMSVCYAPADDGKMRMNFGPINQAGGERRLNVIFSRSKQHMMIVSTITGSQITNTHNEGAANLARFLDYVAAESRGDETASAAVLRALRPEQTDHDSQLQSAAASELAAGLTTRGWDVDIDVGRSLFTVDVGVRDTGGYQLGVMIDPGRETENATARLVADAGVLRAFGWPVTRVFISEWLDHPAQVLDRLEQLLRSGA